MELDVRVLDAGGGPYKPTTLEIVGRGKAPSREEPLRPEQPFADQVPIAIERDRLAGGHLEIDFQMILKVLADARAISDHVDSHVGKICGGTDPRVHQELWRVDGRSRKDDLPTGGNIDHLGPGSQPDASGSPALNDHLFSHSLNEAAVETAKRGMKIGIGGRPATPLPDGLLERTEPFLLTTVVVVGNRIPGLTSCLDKGLVERVRSPPSRHMQRAVAAPPCGVATMAAIVPAFHAFEVGQYIGKGPTRGAHVRPSIKVARVPAHIDHAIDRGGATDDLAARTHQATPAKMRLRLALKAPVVTAHVHRIAERRRHLDKRAGVAAAVFDHDDRITRLTQPVGQRTAG